ncbi:sensitivity to high expression protein she9 [Marasmius tenuissimus]|uniref:Sensitive to high expression protein 9, mitochondrial n=1 Tax=Marasmius tenuissimus TaxID=585030 RepID=A0ABR2ZYG9_9AGAR
MLRTYLRAKRPFSARQFSSSSIVWNLESNKPTDSLDSSQKSSSPPPSQLPESEAGTSSSSPPSSEPSTSTSSQDKSNVQTDGKESFDLESFKSNLRRWTDEAAINFRQKADGFTGTTKTTFSQLGAELNKVTGYDEIEALKREVVARGVCATEIPALSRLTIYIPLEARIQEVRQAARDAKTQYQQAVLQRSNSQRELNDLLQRKSTWTDQDVIRFTTLVREDHTFVQAEARSKAAVDETEEAVEKAFNELTRTILTRYHEEQVWSDKIRSASTYGQLAALGLNLFVFILAIVLVEPWKRRRLAQTFEKKIEEMELEYKTVMETHMKEVQSQLDSQVASLAAVADAVARVDAQLQRSNEAVEKESEEPIVLEPGSWAKAVKDRNFGEAVASGAVVATVLSALGWIWLGG